MTIMIGNDHGGVEMKCVFLPILKERGHTVIDIGTDTDDIVRYPYYAAEVAKAVQKEEVDRGILICSTGVGMSIMANRFSGIRASNVFSSYIAKMTRKHNDSNILCIGGKTVGIAEAIEILTTWLDTEYEGGRHAISLGLIREAEQVICSGDTWCPAERV